MAVKVQDILSIDAVFGDLELLRTPDEIAACSAALGSEIITEGEMLVFGPSRGGAVQGRRMQVPRDRMLVESSAHRTRAARQYPAHIDDVASVVQLMRHAIASTALQGAVPSSFGFNLELVYDQDSGQNAPSYLGRRLLGSRERSAREMGAGGWIRQATSARGDLAMDDHPGTPAASPRYVKGLPRRQSPCPGGADTRCRGDGDAA